VRARRKLAKKAERARYAPFMAGGSPHAGLPIGFAEFDAAGMPDSGAMHAMQARRPHLHMRCLAFYSLRTSQQLSELQHRAAAVPARLGAREGMSKCLKGLRALPGSGPEAAGRGRRRAARSGTAGGMRARVPLWRKAPAARTDRGPCTGTCRAG
jgi:hypothetical protein